MICIFCLQQLQTYSLEQLNTVWEEITGQTTVRMGYIKVLDSQLRSIEDDRIKMVQFSNLINAVSMEYNNSHKIIIKRVKLSYCDLTVANKQNKISLLIV